MASSGSVLGSLIPATSGPAGRTLPTLAAAVAIPGIVSGVLGGLVLAAVPLAGATATAPVRSSRTWVET